MLKKELFDSKENKKNYQQLNNIVFNYPTSAFYGPIERERYKKKEALILYLLDNLKN